MTGQTAMITASGDWLDGDDVRAVRPYAVTGGRTSPSMQLDLVSMVVVTGSDARVDCEHEQVIGLCGRPVSVAEIAATLRLPVAVTKVLVSDLLDWGALGTSGPLTMADVADRDLLERVLDGLQRLL